ncbi:UNVERIFIED_CONTAM: hypothetical protein HDU68_004814 [Siphonaria sp. JEL0065]|nr:hypothetical protein HDU68_004814 [Siphonaria sp. JEL0065]
MCTHQPHMPTLASLTQKECILAQFSPRKKPRDPLFSPRRIQQSATLCRIKHVKLGKDVVVAIDLVPTAASDLGVSLTWLVLSITVKKQKLESQGESHLIPDNNTSFSSGAGVGTGSGTGSGMGSWATGPPISTSKFYIVRPVVFDVDPLLLNKRILKMDMFSKPFIPEWLKDINKLPAIKCPGPFPPAPSLYTYVQQWIAPAYDIATPATNTQRGNLSSTALGIVHVPQVFRVAGGDNDSFAINIPTLSQNRYGWHFTNLVALETSKRVDEMKAFAMYSVRVGGAALTLWEIIVPGILEDSPRIRIGDLVRLRRLTPFDGVEYELPNWNPDTDMFNIEFVYTDIGMRYSTRALMGLDKFVETGYGRKFVFPEPEDAVLTLGTNAKTSLDLGIDFFDEELNWVQKKAVAEIVQNHYGDIPYLIWGPPGTGKTKTVIETIHQIITLNPNARILACAPSHSAADTLTLRLQKFMAPTQLFRFNPPTRPFSEVPSSILPYTYSVNEPDPVNPTIFMDSGYFSIPSMEALLKTRVVVSTCEDAGLLTQCGLNNSFMNETWDVYWENLKKQSPFFARGIQEDSHLFIDEAGQATEPESMIPVSVVVCDPLVSKSGVQSVQVILSGDHMQLGPIVHSEKARKKGLGISYFERLIRRPLYRDHPESRCTPRALNMDDENSGVNDEDGKKESVILHDCVAPFANLVRNYRSHPSFLMTPSHLYYHNTLIPAAPQYLTNSFIGSSFLPNPNIPILFHGVQAKEERILNVAALNNESEGSSAAWYNPSEAAKISELVLMLSRVEGVNLKDFGVISPFREQVKLIRELLRANHLGSVDVGTVEDYQGMERRIILISTVRSNSAYLNQDLKNDLGVVMFPARLNVALTRAQALLLVVGNPYLLVLDPQWVAFLAFYSRNGCCKGCSMPKKVLEAVSNQNSDGLDNYGEMERARDVSKNMMEVPPTRWLGAAAGASGGGFEDDVGDGMDWSREFLEQLGFE